MNHEFCFECESALSIADYREYVEGGADVD